MKKELAKVDNSMAEWLSEEDIELVKSQFFPTTATEKEIKYCLGVAKSFNLNPILKQIFFIPRKSKVDNKWIEKVEPLAGRDSFLTLAHRSGVFESIESTTEIKQVPIQIDNKWQNVDELVGICKIWKKGYKKPFKVEVNYTEYVQKRQDGTITKFWLDKPHTMIKKVAESQCLRKAFDITGLYDETEVNINNEDIIDISINETEKTAPKQALTLESDKTETITKDTTIQDIKDFYTSSDKKVELNKVLTGSGWMEFNTADLNAFMCKLQEI